MKSAYQVVKAWRKKNKEKVNAQARRYRAKHPDKVKAIKQKYRAKPYSKALDTLAARRRRKTDPEGSRRRALAFASRKEARRVEIAGRNRAMQCELCGAFGMTVFDHCHATGVFRGWICDRCNKVLGLVRDSGILLQKMRRYLEGQNEANSQSTEKTA